MSVRPEPPDGLEDLVRYAYLVRDERERNLLVTIRREGRLRLVLELVIIAGIAFMLYYFGFRANEQQREDLQHTACQIEEIVREQTKDFGGTPPPLSPECRTHDLP